MTENTRIHRYRFSYYRPMQAAPFNVRAVMVSEDLDPYLVAGRLKPSGTEWTLVENICTCDKCKNAN